MKHDHYFKPVRHLDEVDIYRVLRLFNVTDPCLQHAVKKLLLAGGRGVKDQAKDISEAIDTLQRWQEMEREDHGEQGRAEEGGLRQGLQREARSGEEERDAQPGAQRVRETAWSVADQCGCGPQEAAGQRRQQRTS